VTKLNDKLKRCCETLTESECVEKQKLPILIVILIVIVIIISNELVKKLTQLL